MKVSEIKVIYSSGSEPKRKIKDSASTYELIIENWNLDTIEFVEEVKILLLNNANEVLGFHFLGRGGSSSCVIDVKIILSVALKAHASGIVVIHNHPSGKLVASEADKSITRKIQKACQLLDIRLLDHLIITKSGYLSFADKGYL
ncbi:DNA repair protein [Nonlabens spongiae]|uniref:DNA repair protein n=1 Tax=Nonlabens spongiae TaxID=331648 RepID=A0A1W6MPA1_9FLAO|nr:JAB domain-containing protein [Nonlabens spongiae]ARN79438.1 DNA repair protein [Nonlabens spongiae]